VAAGEVEHLQTRLELEQPPDQVDVAIAAGVVERVS
jgi:hypothetical protein